jgi:hypothetical protein
MFLVGSFVIGGGRRAIYHSREDQDECYDFRSICHVGRVVVMMTQYHNSEIICGYPGWFHLNPTLGFSRFLSFIETII